jgi:hypothetical protein
MESEESGTERRFERHYWDDENLRILYASSIIVALWLSHRERYTVRSYRLLHQPKKPHVAAFLLDFSQTSPSSDAHQPC